MAKAIKVGVVTRNKMDKTVVVAVERLVRHPMYKRSFKKTSTFLAHDETNRCQVGDRVRIIESRPISSRKRWRVVDIISSAPKAVAEQGVADIDEVADTSAATETTGA